MTHTHLSAATEEVTLEKLQEMQRGAGIPHLPTQFTYVMRSAMSGEGPRAYDWADKPHRLVYDLCREIERIAAEPQAVSVRDALANAIDSPTVEAIAKIMNFRNQNFTKSLGEQLVDVLQPRLSVALSRPQNKGDQ